MKTRAALEKKIQADIQAAIGSEPDLFLTKNSNGKARHFGADDAEYVVPYGLGVGSPDLVGILAPRGRWFCLEIKIPGETPDAQQEKCHAVWRGFGAFVAVVTSVIEARDALARARAES